MRYLILSFAILCLSCSAAFARPVSYPNGWTIMFMNDPFSNSSHIHYSPTAKYSIGWLHEYMRGPDAHADFAQLNYLIKRWNKQGSQANLYWKSGVGAAYDGDDTNLAAFGEVAADWETRRWFTSYSVRAFDAGDISSYVHQKARVGVAPYIGDYGDIHTWLMLQADYRPKLDNDEEFSVTPLVRFFKGPALLEAGYNLDDGALFNFVYRF